jgi:hypothetical protein
MTMQEISTTPTRQGGIEPEFFRLPKSGPDIFFGLTRSWYYLAESRGWIKLKRLRERGKLRGVTLIPYKSVKDFLSREEAGHE